MDQPDLDEESKKARKAQVVAWREKKRFSTIFMLLASLFEIAESILVILVLFLLSSIFFLKILDQSNPTVQFAIEISTLFVFVGGIVIGFIIYKKTVSWFIRKMKWESKLSDEVLYHYQKKNKKEIEEELKK